MAVEVIATGTIAEAASAVGAARGSRFFGGGTMLMCAVNYGSQSLSRLVRCTDPVLEEIRPSSSGIRIGAMVTMSAVLANRDLAFLHKAALSVGGPALRSAATVGGNLFVHPPYGDFATALLALGATVEFAGGSSISIDDFFRDRDRHADRIVVAAVVPRVANADALRFRKVSRVHPKGAAVMTLSAYLPRSGGRIEGFRVAYGNMGPVPVRAAAVEKALEGASLDEAGVARALAVASEGIEPPTDALASTWYRREVLPVHLKRLLLNRAN